MSRDVTDFMGSVLAFWTGAGLLALFCQSALIGSEWSWRQKVLVLLVDGPLGWFGLFAWGFVRVWQTVWRWVA